MSDLITEAQGRKIISLLENIVSELKSIQDDTAKIPDLAWNMGRVQEDVSDMQLNVKWIEKKVSS
jgi:hypothetical protein